MKITISLDCSCGKTEPEQPIELECDDWGFDNESCSLLVAKAGKKIFMAPWNKVRAVKQESE